MEGFTYIYVGMVVLSMIGRTLSSFTIHGNTCI